MQTPFPILHDSTEMRIALEDRSEIRFMPQTNGTTVCSYIVAGADTFRCPFSREARGVTFDQDGKIIARPLHKFFNVNERPETQIAALDWSKVVRIMDKRDGSMIHTVAFDGSFIFKSKKSYTSDVAVQATAFVTAGSKSTDGQERRYQAMCHDLTMNGKTAIFEWTSPVARIVLAYAQPELRLLHVRDNVTGEYMTRDELVKLGNLYNVPGVDDASINDVGSATFDHVLDAIKNRTLQNLVDTVEGIEGWVFQFENGEMVKLKTKWYMDRHHAMTFLRVRDIARMVVDETLDDLKAKLVGDGIKIDQILEIERAVVAEIEAIEQEIDALFATTIGQDRKTIALANKGHRYFALLMQKVSGREPDVKSFFERTKLDEMFDLTQLNMVDAVSTEE